MDKTIYKIAIAGFLHDIGKFAERAGWDVVDKNYFENNAQLYCPYIKEQKRFTHRHSIYTAGFIEKFSNHLPDELKGGYEEGNSLINLAAMHHKPETPLQWIVAIADRVSSGFDRQEFDEKYNKEIDVRDYKKTRLLTILEAISLDNQRRFNQLEDYQYRYPLKELSPLNIFPQNSEDIRKIDDEKANEDYRVLFLSFISAFDKLSHKENAALWFEHFDTLFMIYASHIPAATVGYIVPDVSLYDHSRATSALASALYQYHIENNSLEIEKIKDYDVKKFLLITGDFYGIQDFIFASGGSTNKASAKLLRGRSFYVALLSELATDMLCRELKLPVTSVILNAAGKFTILAQNTDKALGVLKNVEERINEWLIKNFYGQASIGFSFIEASCDDFVSGRFSQLWERLSKAGDKKKYAKFDLIKYGGSVHNYLDSFYNDLGICPFCNKRPADRNAMVKDEYACKICYDHIFIGTNLVKEEQIAITSVDARLQGGKLLEPIFGRYQIAFATGELKELSREGKLYKFWNIGISETYEIARNITVKFINGYVPKYEKDELTNEAIDIILAGRKTDKLKDELFDTLEVGVPKTFLYLAKKSLKYDSAGKARGVEALGVLKADVDNLGLLFACGIPKDRLTLSRIATMSRQLNNYFSIYIPYVLKKNAQFKNIYTVFSGGDDLFLIGPWNVMIEFAEFIYESFSKYVCENKGITISAGISFHKPNTPVFTYAEDSEHALKMSKYEGRNRVTIFHTTIEWKKLNEIKKIKEELRKWLESEIINNAMLFRLNEFIQMKEQEDKLLKLNTFSLKDMECMKWRARFKYTVVRNVGRKMKNEEKLRAIEEVMNIAQWLEKYSGSLRIPLWQIIYERRGG